MQATSRTSLKSLERLVGTWKLTGDATGRTWFEWMKGGRFLLQEVDMRHAGRRIQGLEVIGHLQRIGEKPTKDIRSRFYSANDGLTLDYVHELTGDRYTIWFGERGSNSRFVGRFTPDGSCYSGAWRWPGGGYSVTCTRMGRETGGARRT